jgi:glycosyltransferase involved in cell wall biosynthesis
MKVLVVNNAAPFIRGGAEELADNLVTQLNATTGVEAELLRVPFSWTPSERLIDEIVLNRSLRLWGVDRVIGLKFPAYLIPHPHQVLWILHQFRQAYDLGDAGQGLSRTGRDGEIRAAIHAADQACFNQAQAIFVNSPVTQGRLMTYNGTAGEVLYPPLNDAPLFGGGDLGGYLFAGGRITPGKRQALLIEAMAHVKGSGRLLIAGPPETPAYGAELARRVAELGLSGRVQLRFGFYPRGQIARWVNDARACVYAPYDEDSLGYVAMEAFSAGKAVITTTDSGGLLEMVLDGATGLVTAPQPEAMAEALAALFADPALAERLGKAARRDWEQRNLTWPATVARLLA